MLKAKAHGYSIKMLTIFIIHTKYHFTLLSLSSQESESHLGAPRDPLDPLHVRVVIRPITSSLPPPGTGNLPPDCQSATADGVKNAVTLSPPSPRVTG